MVLFIIGYILVALPILLMLPTRVKGRKNLIKDKRNILICNHRSNFDAVLLDFYLRKRIRFLGKKELFENKFMGFLYGKVIGAVKINRGHADLTSVKTVLNLLKQEKTVGIFPQGTRVKGEQENIEIKNGVCLFAIKSKSPIVPTYIVKKPRLFSFNTILIGKPFELSEFYDVKLTKEVLDQAGDRVQASIEELKECYEKRLQEKALKKQYKKIKKQNKQKS